MSPKTLSFLVPFALTLPLTACQTETPVPEGCYVGTLTGEGATCQAMRDSSERLYSFYADMSGFELGETVCVCGPIAAMSFCNQGTVIEVTHLDRTCPKAAE